MIPLPYRLAKEHRTHCRIMLVHSALQPDCTIQGSYSEEPKSLLSSLCCLGKRLFLCRTIQNPIDSISKTIGAGAQEWSRTIDLTVISRTLSQLSYMCIHVASFCDVHHLSLLKWILKGITIIARDLLAHLAWWKVQESNLSL